MRLLSATSVFVHDWRLAMKALNWFVILIESRALRARLLQGIVLLAAFWAGWCPVCRRRIDTGPTDPRGRPPEMDDTS